MTGFIIYFTLLSIAHLFFCYFGMHTPRKLTKPLLLLSLAACYACAAKPVDGAVLAALICGLAGDILLIWEKNDKFFIPGALSFTLGHGLYALSIFRRTPGATQSHLITAAVFMAAYIAVVAYMSFRLEKHVDDKKFRVLMPVYLSIVAAERFCVGEPCGADKFGRRPVLRRADNAWVNAVLDFGHNTCALHVRARC